MNYAGKFGSGGLDSSSTAHLDLDSLSHRGGPGDTVTVPDAHLLFSGDFARSGRDLIISDASHRFVVQNYFDVHKRPALVSPDGAPLDPRVVDALTGHVDYAQAGGAPAAKVVGNVVKMTGSASVVRNGVTVVLNNGDALYQGDVVQTGSGSTIGLVLIDGTAFNLTANARLMLNDLTYDANSSSNSSLLTLVQGAASFVAGQVAKTGDMKVATPVATMGIRGTAVLLDISAIDGKVSVSVMDQGDGQVHSVQVFAPGPAGNLVLIGTVTSTGAGLTLTPTATFEVIAQESNKTPAQVAAEFNAFQSLLSTYDAGKQLFPNLPQHTENTGGGDNNTTSPATTTKYASSAPANPTAPEYHPPAGSTSVASTSVQTVQVVVTTSSSGGGGGGGGPPTTPTTTTDTTPVIKTVTPVPVPVPFVVTPPTVASITADGGDHNAPVMSASGDVVYDPDGVIYFYDRESKTTIRVTPDDGHTYSGQTISSDGRYVVYQSDDGGQSHVYVWGTDPADAAHYHVPTLIGAGGAPAVSGDGHTIAVELGGKIGIYDLDGHLKGTITAAAVNATGSLWLPSVSADGHIIAFWSSDTGSPGGPGHLYVYDKTTATYTEIASVATGAGNHTASISADGHLVAYEGVSAEGRAEIYLYDLNTDQVVFSTESLDVTFEGASRNPVISPDGKFIIFTSDARLLAADGNAFADTYMVDVTNPAAPTFKLISEGSNGASDGGVAISAGGAYVAFASNSSFAGGGATANSNIFFADPTSGRSAIIEQTSAAPSTLSTSGTIAITGAVEGVTLNVTDAAGNPTSLLTASLNSGSINWTFAESKSDFAGLAYGQDTTKSFIITMSSSSGGGTTTIPVSITVHNAVQPTIIAVNAPPVAVPLTMSAGQEDKSYVIAPATLLNAVSDVDGPTPTITSVTVQSGGGTVSQNGSGDWIYTPPVNSTGRVVLNYTASDGTLSANSTASFTLVGTGVTHVGDDGNNTLTGTAANDVFEGFGGDDTIIGNAGVDRAVYTDATGGIAVNLAAGTVSGPGVGADTLVGVEAIQASNFADNLSAAGFTGNSAAPGVPLGFNSFEGMGGDDIITGNVNGQSQKLTRIVYNNATAAVTVDFALGQAHGTAPGDLSNTGTDTFTNVNAVIGSAYGDTLLGSNNAPGTYEQYEGRRGNDTIDGRGGYDFAVYNNDPDTASGITVDMAAGSVVGDSSIGTDTLRSVEGVRGTNFHDVYHAENFGMAGYLNPATNNVGSNGTFNNFDGAGGNDSIFGNGNTRIQYTNASAGVTVDFALGTAHGTAPGDLSNTGTDTFSGVNAVMGSTFDDDLRGDGNNNNIMGLAGDDFIDGRGGFDTAQYNNIVYATGGISVDMRAGIVTGDGSIGTDTLRGIEAVVGTNFQDVYHAENFGMSGYLNPATNNVGIFGTFNQFEGAGGDDQVWGNGNTKVGYFGATAAVTVDLEDTSTDGTGTARASDSDAGIGVDTFHGGIGGIGGSNFDDTLRGSNNANGTVEQFDGRAGDDLIDGRGGYDQAIYNVDAVTSAITVTMTGTGGTVDGNGSVGHDTLVSVESVIGTRFGDSYDAHLFSGFNEFQALGGDDSITGNGFTQIGYFQASAGIIVDLQDTSSGGTGTARSIVGNNAGIGLDTIHGGVNSVQASNFNDILLGSTANEFFGGLSGDDQIDGRGGGDFMMGNAGADTFVYSLGYGNARVGDFSHSAGDKIDLRGVPGVFSLNDLQMSQFGAGNADTLIQFGDGGSLVLSNINFSGLVAGDFIFAAPDNHAPIVSLTGGDSGGTTLHETNDTLGATGTLTISDADGTDQVTVSSSVTHDGPTGGLSDATLQSYFAVPLTAVLVSGQTSAHFSWTFDSKGQTFGYLKAGETLTLNYTIMPDDGHSTAGAGNQVVTLTIGGENDAPLLNSAALGAVPEDTPESGIAGATVADLFGPEFSDIDGSMLGIVVSGNSAAPAEGVWQYKTPASGVWEDIGSPDPGHALAFSNDTMLRFVPAPEFSGTPGSLEVHAIDDTYDEEFTIGSDPGGGGRYTINITDDGDEPLGHGGTSPISDEAVELTTSVTSVNDAPVFTGQSLNATADPGAAAVAIVANVVAEDVDSDNYDGGSLTAAITSGLDAGDTLSIMATGYIKLNGTSVLYDSSGNDLSYVEIGTLTAGTDNLTIALNAEATDAAVSRLTSAIGFENTGVMPFNGIRTITFTLQDGSHDSTSFAAGVWVPPTTMEDDPVTFGLGAQPVFIAGPAHGTLTHGLDGYVTYTPDQDFNGTDTFTYINSAQTTDNLIVNPGAELGPSVVGEGFGPTPQAWTLDSGYLTAVDYTSPSFGLNGTAIGGGDSFFSGGPANSVSSISQVIDVSSYSADIDAGAMTANLSGYLGGYYGQDDNITVTVHFLDAGDVDLGSVLDIGPVLAADRPFGTSLAYVSDSIAVPVGTQHITVTVTSTKTSGSYNDGYADNLSLTLSHGGTQPEPTVAHVTVHPVNDAPSVDLDSGSPESDYSGTYYVGGAPVSIAADATVTDPDSEFAEGATVVLASGGVDGDYFTVDGSSDSSGYLLSGNIFWEVSGTPGGDPPLTITFSGFTETTDYAAAIAAVAFGTTSTDPRSVDITVTVNDGTDAQSATSHIDVSVSTDNVWTGAASDDWNQPLNWSLGHVPTSADNVTINDATVQVEIADDQYAINQLTLASPGSSALELHISGTSLGRFIVNSTLSNDGWLQVQYTNFDAPAVVTNSGLITGDGPGSVLNFGSLSGVDVDNTGGSIQANEGANAYFINATVLGGDIGAQDGLSLIYMRGSTFVGSEVWAVNDGRVTISAAPPGQSSITTFDGSAASFTMDANVTIESGATLNLVGTIHNQDSIIVDPGTQAQASRITITDTVTMRQNGQIVLKDVNLSVITSADGQTATLDFDEGTISGTGRLGGGNLNLIIGGGGAQVAADVHGFGILIDTGSGTLINDGVISSEDTGGVTIAGAIVNHGYLQANEGLIEVVGAVSGAGQAEIVDGTLKFDAASDAHVNFMPSLSSHTGTLVLGDIEHFTGTITGYSFGDTIHVIGHMDLNLQQDGTGDLQLGFGSSGQHVSLGNYQSGAFSFVNDGVGGSYLVFNQRETVSDALVSPSTYAVGSALPGTISGGSAGIEVIGVSADGINFVDVTPEAGNHVDGAYLRFEAFANGSTTWTVGPGYVDASALVDTIEGHENQSLTDTFYYKVLGPGGNIWIDTIHYRLSDLSFGGVGQRTLGVASGDSLSLGELAVHDWGNSNPGITPSQISVTVTVGLGELSLGSPGSSPATVDFSDDNRSVTIYGTESEINATLNDLFFTSGTAGHTDITMRGNDGQASTGTYYVGTIAVDNVPPSALGDMAVITAKGHAVAVTTQDLNVNDPDDSNHDNLIFTVLGSDHGTLRHAVDWVELGVGSTFTLADIEAGRIFYQAPADYTGQDHIRLSLSDNVSGAPTVLVDLGATSVDAQLTVLTTAGYDFVGESPALVMGNGVVVPDAADPDASFTIYNAEAGRKFVYSGTGFAYDGPNNVVTAGRVVSITETDLSDHPLARLDIDVDAATWYSAIVAKAAGDNAPLEALAHDWTFFFLGNGGNDAFDGGDLNDYFAGRPGNDTFLGHFGYDRANYSNASGGITVDLAAGTVIGDASVGTDTLDSIELVTGSDHDDSYDARGFSANSINAGSTVTSNVAGLFNEFEGRGGTDTVIGNASTRISYYHATAGVTVTFDSNSWNVAFNPVGGASGTATGDASVGTDHFSGVYSARGSFFNDAFDGSTNPSGTSENFEGLGGDDDIDGGGGFDRAVYNLATDGAGIDVQLAAGVVTGGADTGTDTLRSIEGIWGTEYDDTYDATGFTAAGASQSVNAGTTQFSPTNPTLTSFNEFEGGGGNDTITGNGATRIAFYHATSGVLVQLGDGATHGIALGSSTGQDDIVGFVSRVRGSEFNDWIVGNADSNVLEGQSGNDLLRGLGNFDVYTGGVGADTFVFDAIGGLAATGNVDTINDFKGHGNEGDRIDVRTVPGITSFSQLTLTQVGANTEITFGTYGPGNLAKIILIGVNSSTLTASDFIIGNQVNVQVQTPDGYDFSTLYDDMAGSVVQSARDSEHMLVFNAERGITFELIGSGFAYDAGGHPTAGTINEIHILDANLADFTDYAAIHDHTLVDSDGWAISAPGLFGAVGDYASSNPVTHADGLAALNTIFNSARYSVAGASNFVTTDTEGHTGNDALFGGDQADTFVGLSGSDTVDYSHATQAVAASLANPASNTNAAAGDLYSSVENLRGTDFADTLTGDGNNNVLEGGPAGDTLVGGGGADTASYEHAAAAVDVDLATPGNNTGDAASDSYNSIENIRGSSFDDTLSGDNDNNTIEGGLGNDTIIGGGGNNTASYEHATAAVAVDLSLSGAQITGGAGTDTLNEIQNLNGSQYNDLLTGSSADNLLIGMGGSDTFAFKAEAVGGIGHDTIGDFSPGEDHIALDYVAFDASGPNDFNHWIATHASTPLGTGDTLIDLDPDGLHAGEQTILLKNVAIANLHASDFVLPAFFGN